MLIVSYDITSNKTREKFSKFLKQFGNKIQYSVYSIKNSDRILNNILAEIECTFKKRFKKTDSVLIFSTCLACDKKIIRFGSAVHEEKDIVYLE